MTTAAPFSEKTSSHKVPKEKTKPLSSPIWHVIVLNDAVNLMPYVVMVFQRVFGYDRSKAKQHMLEVHQDGQSILWSGPREKAEHYLYQLQQWQLNAMLIRDA